MEGDVVTNGRAYLSTARWLDDVLCLTLCVESSSGGGAVCSFFLGAVSFFLAGLLLKLICSQARWTSIPFMLLGIAFGVFADAGYDFFVNDHDQNLWPFGIIMWWVVSPIPIAGGLALGMAIRSRGGD